MSKKTPRVTRGVLDHFYETGTEGVMWVLVKDGKQGYESLAFLEAGDRLKVFAENDWVIFEGKIIPDYKVGWRRRYKYARHGQPIALGYWIHWTQKGWPPDAWAMLFIRSGAEKLRAELIQKKPRQ